jgi:hypothetical protein
VRKDYADGIVIYGSKVQNGNPTSLGTTKGRQFIDATSNWLDEIRKTSSGQRMIAAIAESGHTVSIYRTWTITDGNYRAGGDAAKGLVVALGTKYGGGETELKRVLDKASEDMSGRSGVKKFLGIGKAKPKFLKRDAIARLVGITPGDLKKMEEGRMAISMHVESKLKVYLYDFLTYGEGDSCHVGFNHLRENLSEEHKRYLPQSHTWQNRPPGVALAHELIHAWSFMIGQRPFPYGWEEEAMTVGLPPFSMLREFTENKIRVEWGGLAVRPDYESGLEFKSGIIDPDAQKIGIDAGTKKWKGKQEALHTQQPLAQAASARRRAMGFEEDDQDDEW